MKHRIYESLNLGENKIWAEDQKSQLLDYSKWLAIFKTEHYILVYLTPDGKLPSDKSIKEKEWLSLVEQEKAINISYKKDIIPLIEKWSLNDFCKASRVKFVLGDFYEYLHTYFLGKKLNNEIKIKMREIVYNNPDETLELVKAFNQIVENRKGLVDSVYENYSARPKERSESNLDLKITRPFINKDYYAIKLIIKFHGDEFWYHLSQKYSKIILKVTKDFEKYNSFELMPDIDIQNDDNINDLKELCRSKLFGKIVFSKNVSAETLSDIFYNQSELLIQKIKETHNLVNSSDSQKVC
jgi:hypothetical protein